jgi:hypothetical protein
MIDSLHPLLCTPNLRIKRQFFFSQETDSGSFFVTVDGMYNKVKVTLEQAMKAQRGSRGIALLFL